MGNDKSIEHEGIVRAIEGRNVKVEILSKSACSGCSARSLCSSSEQKVKEIDVETSEGERYEIGESVTVVGMESMGLIAVMICYVVPVVLMVATMGVLTRMGNEDTIVGLAGLGVLVPYFIIVYLMRERLGRRFKFKIKK